MTTDGSFTLGVALTGYMIIRGYPPFFTTFFSFCAGSLAGMVTAWLSTSLGILNLLSGILTMTALYSVNYRIMGQQIPFYDLETIFSICTSHTQILFLLIAIISVIFFAIYFFLKTEIGLALRAIGHNPKMSRANGIDDKKMIFLGLGLSNALISLAGSLWAQFHIFSEINMGSGMLIHGLAAVIIGEAILRKNTVFYGLVSCFVGALSYKIFLNAAYNADILGLVSSDIPLISSVLIASAVVFAKLHQRRF
jgi:putative ABC transport system permease protein